MEWGASEGTREAYSGGFGHGVYYPRDKGVHVQTKKEQRKSALTSMTSLGSSDMLYYLSECKFCEFFRISVQISLYRNG
jgi:hypothetical protein